jgi:hypothetical protein
VWGETVGGLGVGGRGELVILKPDGDEKNRVLDGQRLHGLSEQELVHSDDP